MSVSNYNFNLNHTAYKGNEHIYLVVSLDRRDLEDNICYKQQLQYKSVYVIYLLQYINDCWIIMASKVFVVSVMLLFSIAIVRSENQDDVNCTDVNNQFNHGNVCTLYQDIIKHDYLIKHYPDATEDFYRNVSQQLTVFCASQCKPILEAFFKCQNETNGIIGLNYGTCGKINQEFCYVHHLRGTTAGTIVSFNKFRRICPYNINTNRRTVLKVLVNIM